MTFQPQQPTNSNVQWMRTQHTAAVAFHNPPPKPTVIKYVNVGGQVFTYVPEVLKEKGAVKIIEMINTSPYQDVNGFPYIDRDSNLFSCILSYMRGYSLDWIFDSWTRRKVEGLIVEANFYGCGEIATRLLTKMNEPAQGSTCILYGDMHKVIYEYGSKSMELNGVGWSTAIKKLEIEGFQHKASGIVENNSKLCLVYSKSGN